MSLKDYAICYLVLALFQLACQEMGVNFWQLAQPQRPAWLATALLVLVLTALLVGRKRGPIRPSAAGRR